MLKVIAIYVRKLRITILFLFILIINASLLLYSCKTEDKTGDTALQEFIDEAAEYGLPTAYLETVSDMIRIRYRARPAYANGVVYLTDAFDENGDIILFSLMDSFEISSIYHECFHAYVDLIIRQGLAENEVKQSFDNIMKNSLDYYTKASDGRKIVWDYYREQSSEEAMAIQITNLIKYRIVYEKTAEKLARNYIYGKLDMEQLIEGMASINGDWNDVLEGKISRGYYNRNFLRWRFEHIVDVKEYISPDEALFVEKFILPGIDQKIEIPPLTEFIRNLSMNDLPCSFMIEVNKNHMWKEKPSAALFEEMDERQISGLYCRAFELYWEKVLKKEIAPGMEERISFKNLVHWIDDWYGEEGVSSIKRMEIARNALIEYMKKLMEEKVKWQRMLAISVVSGQDFDIEEFKKCWKEAVEGRSCFGYYSDTGGNMIKPGREISLAEKEFILNYILTDLNDSFGRLLSTEPVPAREEIRAGAGVEGSLSY